MKQKPQQSNIELYPYDFVIKKSNGELYSFKDGEIIIYRMKETAVKDSKDFPGSKVISTTQLTRKGRKELRKNIKEHNVLPF